MPLFCYASDNRRVIASADSVGVVAPKRQVPELPFVSHGRSSDMRARRLFGFQSRFMMLSLGDSLFSK